jgi:hypothetical protein
VASLVNTFPQAFLEVLHHSLQHGGRNCCHFVSDVLFQIHRCPWCLFVHLALEISSEEEVLRLGTLIPMNIEVPTKYQLSHNDRIVVFFKYVSTAKARCSTDQRSMATEMLWVSLEGRSRTNSPRQRFHWQLCYQIVRYFCRTLYHLHLSHATTLMLCTPLCFPCKWHGPMMSAWKVETCNQLRTTRNK